MSHSLCHKPRAHPGGLAASLLAISAWSTGFPVLVQRVVCESVALVFLPLESLPAGGELIAGQTHNMERIHNPPGVGHKFFTGRGIALESVHGDDAYLTAKLGCSCSKPGTQRISTAAFDHIQ